jgi:hypothetical protein
MSQKEYFHGLSVAPPPINADPWWLNVAIEVLCFACLGVILALAIMRRAPSRASRWRTRTSPSRYLRRSLRAERPDQQSPIQGRMEGRRKTYRGCWGPRPDVEAVLFYFDDKTMG